MILEYLTVAGLGGLAGHAAEHFGWHLFNHKAGDLVRKFSERIAGLRGLPSNLEIERSVRVAQLQGLEYVLKDYRERVERTGAVAADRKLADFVEKAEGFVRNHLRRRWKIQVEGLGGSSEALAELAGVAAMKPQENPQQRLARLRALAEDAVLDEIRQTLHGGEIPPAFERHFRGSEEPDRTGWFTAFSAYLAQQARHNDHFRNDLVVNFLGDIQQFGLDTHQFLKAIDVQADKAMGVLKTIDARTAVIEDKLNSLLWTSLAIPHFEEKFAWVFLHHPAIRSYDDLANAIGIPAGMVRTWRDGSTYSPAQQLPLRYFAVVCEILFVAEDAMLLEDLDEFKLRVQVRPTPPRWETLALRSVASSELHVLRAEDVKRDPTLVLAPRALRDPDEEESEIERFRLDEDVLVRLDARPGWHAVLLLRDRDGWQRLHPTSRRSDTSIDHPLFFPPQRPDAPRFTRFSGAAGGHKLVAVLTDAPFPDALRDALAGGHDLPETLGRLAVFLGSPSAGVKIIHFRCYVEA